jgi:hypothetical protein
LAAECKNKDSPEHAEAEVQGALLGEQQDSINKRSTREWSDFQSEHKHKKTVRMNTG